MHKVYFAPATPCDRLLAHRSVGPPIKEKLTAQFMSLDPVRLLQEIRLAQQTLSDLAAHGVMPRWWQAHPPLPTSSPAWRRRGRTGRHGQRIANSPRPNTGGRPEWPLADQDLGRHRRLTSIAHALPGHPQVASGALAGGQLPAQCSTSLRIQRLVDRLMPDAYRSVFGEINQHAVGDLLRARSPPVPI